MVRLPSRMAVAVHEAGHAAMRLDGPSYRTIRCMVLDKPGDGLLGRVGVNSLWQTGVHDQKRASKTDLADWRDRARRDIVYYLAGPIAELRWKRYSRLAIQVCGYLYARQCLEGANGTGTDLERTAARLRWLNPSKEEAAFDELWNKAEERVARLYLRIVALRRRLSETGFVLSTEIEEEWRQSGSLLRRRSPPIVSSTNAGNSPAGTVA